MHECAVCGKTHKADKWNTIRVGDEGWFFQMDGTAYCPEHVPDWVPRWRASKRWKVRKDDATSRL